MVPAIVTIPSTDPAFRAHVDHLRRRHDLDTPEALNSRLRRLYPRAVVRARDLANESPVWYVYRDGSWQPEAVQTWWLEPRVPRFELTVDGWIVAANPAARGLLGIPESEELERYYSDFVAPGTLDDASALFEIVAAGSDLAATVRIRPTTGDVIAIELRASRDGERVVCWMRLADDIEVEASPTAERPLLRCRPPEDTVFAAYARQLLARMSEPTPAELALRLRRLYPHAAVEAGPEGWEVSREPVTVGPGSTWWLDPSLPTVRFDERGLILDANDAAQALLGTDIVGHHWQEIVTPGSNDQVAPIIALIKEAGGAVSRFRMPAAGGSLVEFDSYTSVDGDVLTTVMRPVAAPDQATAR